jgi:hypothetical protein
MKEAKKADDAPQQARLTEEQRQLLSSQFNTQTR